MTADASLIALLTFLSLWWLAGIAFVPQIAASTTALSEAIYKNVIAYFALFLGLKLGPSQSWLRYAILFGVLAALVGASLQLDGLDSIATAGLAVFAVLVVSWEWSINEAHREALMTGHLPTQPLYWLPPKWEKSGNDVKSQTDPAKDVDSIPDLWDEALVSSVLLFPLLAFLGLATLNANIPGESPTILTWMGHILDRFLHTLPVDVLELSNSAGLALPIEEREPNTITALSVFDFAASFALTFAIVTGVARLIQRRRMTNFALDALGSNPQYAARLGKRALREFERRSESKGGEIFAASDTVKPSAEFIKMIKDILASRSNNSEYVAGALRAAGRLGHKDFVALVCTRLQADTATTADNTTLEAACEAIRALAMAEASRDAVYESTADFDLLKLLSNERCSEGVKQEAAKAFSLLNAPKHRKPLTDLFKSQATPEGVAAILAASVAELREYHLVSAVASKLDSATSEDLKIACLNAIPKLNITGSVQQTAIDALCKFLEASAAGDLVVRLAAAKAIDQVTFFDDEAESVIAPQKFLRATVALDQIKNDLVASPSGKRDQSAAMIGDLIKRIGQSQIAVPAK